MKTKILALAGVAAFALTVSATASNAGYFLPGETMGVSLDSPLPEGVFFADLESYGRSDTQPDLNIGVNIPVILWSTPWSFYNNRLEFLAAFPFAHIDAKTGIAPLDAAVNQVGAITYALGPILSHDFGNGLTGGISAFVRSPSPSTNLRDIDGRNVTEGDFRESLQYTISTPGIFQGVTLIENAGVTTSFGQGYHNFQQTVPVLFGAVSAQNDMFAGDFTIEKTFDKFTIGFTGFGNTDIDNKNIAVGGTRSSSVEVGGLIGYDFGRFTLTGIVTRTIYASGGSLVPGGSVSDTVAGVLSGNGYETRGWVRVIVPLYVAPSAPVVTARY